MVYYLVEKLNRKSGKISESCPIEVPEEILKKWMQPYKDYLVEKLAHDLLIKKSG